MQERRWGGKKRLKLLLASLLTLSSLERWGGGGGSSRRLLLLAILFVGIFSGLFLFCEHLEFVVLLWRLIRKKSHKDEITTRVREGGDKATSAMIATRTRRWCEFQLTGQGLAHCLYSLLCVHLHEIRSSLHVDGQIFWFVLHALTRCKQKS